MTGHKQHPSASATSPDDARSGSKLTGRSRGRELALWILCHLESHPGAERDALDLFWREPPRLELGDDFLGPLAAELGPLLADSAARRWSRRLVEGFLADAAGIDETIEAASRRWRLVRMDRVDRSLLRLSTVELRGESTPRNVVVAEAVRLASRYGSERSAAFVNGVAEALARVLRDAQPDEPDEPDEGADP
ncbi:hypothetical protein ENSA5_07930 [Enhygromyxa salina]|uniref:Transcription antitermination protein NusB n=1 Tax=Enhygromyxa salina TaxID=215803 RepID=A0A2S9YH10_9BACT|nr:transcription antitermination factor NusB [Enhygromyxa salina]PRQ04390.1 hypothetical protein ENSA5_07930 [Enhygromyxa salina]